MAKSKPKQHHELYVYQYQFLDDLSFIQNPSKVSIFANMEPPDLESLISSVREQFSTAGWEGDGNLGVIWLPPFVDVGIEDTWGTYVWHVKQSNNGLSWIASNSPLNFARLRDQNKNLPSDTHLPASIVYTDCLTLKNKAEQLARDVLRKLKALAGLKGRVIADIRDELLIVAQGEMVAQLNEFLDDCYLEVLQEVFSEGNRSRLTLGKFKASLNPAHYIPKDADSEPTTLDPAGAEWFPMRGLIKDIWLSYRFEAFREKTNMLFRACEYKIDPSLHQELRKHVQLRNCIQHHQRRVNKESLEMVGVQKFTLIEDDGKSVQLGSGDKISFSAKEIIAFARVLIQLASTFDTHIRKRVRSLAWVPRKLGNEALVTKKRLTA
jgi:hypothetical protein